MLCHNTFGSNEAKIVCNQLGYVNNGRSKLLFIIAYINKIIFVAIMWYTVSNPLTLPKDSLSVILHLSCIGNETNITDCIDSEPAFVTLCNNSQSEFIAVTCPGMTALPFRII